jgi:Holliday junction DNA helicase RuvB
MKSKELARIPLTQFVFLYKWAERISTVAEEQPIVNLDYGLTGLNHLVGQSKVLSVLRTHLDAFWNDRSAGRNASLSDLLFLGPPGTGKTQTASVLASELAVPITVVTADALNTAAACCRTLIELEPESILFIDEIHSISRFPVSEGILLKALAERKVCLGGAYSKKPTTIELPRCCIIGATTDPFMLHPALVQRFTVLNFDFYSHEELTEIARRRAKAMNVELEDGVLDELAKRAKETPRICLALLKACHKYARSLNADKITMEHVGKTMEQLQVDELGLDGLERKYLQLLHEGGGCVRLNVLALRLGLPVRTLTRMVEPFIVKQGLTCTTERGRELTPKGIDYLKTYPKPQ